MSGVKPCATCGHGKGYHHYGAEGFPTACTVWPMVGTWSRCPCDEYVELVEDVEP